MPSRRVHHGANDLTLQHRLQDVDDEIIAPVKAGEKEKRKPHRRKRPRLVPPHSRSSRFRGVYWEPKGSKWYSSISSNHKVCIHQKALVEFESKTAINYDRLMYGPRRLLQQIHLGSFNTEEEAAQAFDQEAIRLRGPATFTNFPRDMYALESGEAAATIRQRMLAKRPPNAVRSASARQRWRSYSPSSPTESATCSTALSLPCMGPGAARTRRKIQTKNGLRQQTVSSKAKKKKSAHPLQHLCPRLGLRKTIRQRTPSSRWAIASLDGPRRLQH